MKSNNSTYDQETMRTCSTGSSPYGRRTTDETPTSMTRTVVTGGPLLDL